MRRLLCCWISGLAIWLMVAEVAKGQTDKIADGSATVNGWQITSERVDRFLQKRLAGRIVSDQIQAALRADALEQLVRRQVILEYLKTTRHIAGPGQIQLELDGLVKRLAQVDTTLEQHLKKNGLSEDELRNEIAWTLSWQNYLNHYLTDDGLRRFYEMMPRRYDGTRLRVAHVLLDKASGQESGIKPAELLDKIRSGEIAWADAVKKFSQAKSSARRDGLVGWIEWDQPMPPAFTRQAFQLDPGEISDPVETSFGIHLIKCLEIKPGNRGPLDVRQELKDGATEYLFNKLAREKRSAVQIVYGSKNGDRFN